VEVVASLSQGRIAAAQCGLFTHKSAPVIFEPPCTTDLSEFGEVTLFQPHETMRSFTGRADICSYWTADAETSLCP